MPVSRRELTAPPASTKDVDRPTTEPENDVETRFSNPGNSSSTGQTHPPAREPDEAVAAEPPVEDDAGGDVAAVPPAGLGAVAVAFALIGAAALLAHQLWHHDATTSIIRPTEPTAVFLALIVFAAAVERLIEPFTHWVPGGSASARLAEAEVAAARPQAGEGSRRRLVEARARAARARANRSVVLWGVAAAVAALLSTTCGFYVLHALASPSWNGVPVWADALVTGILVGSGTKPVHDLLSRAQPGGQ
jgi:hypothetical protein